ncbi:ArsR family transcriptional regulator [Streptomyces sioyaensis]|uniref:ArsR family transcriptional regulator n=1 Tax=Streptomyces sioyaensis TaxID=67364 RepID=A0A4V1NPP4_9ACTN|nr:ArsR family transcriptional regulator [Streptomyces sioyaensis]MBM4791031.1 ArsR family transcriptional regulator [Streptomyces sioyaensis]RXS65530.1 ArsR family transcriptional regulator [Streptomyces sioyaensis]
MKYASEEKEGPAAEQTAGPAASAPEQSEQAGRRAAGAGHPAAPHDEQQGTRNKVARSILDHGPSTAAELALRLELTQAAVRRHLDALAAEGVVEPREKRVYGTRGRGRPARAFALTDCGRDAFDQAYDQLATDALRWIAQSAGGGEKGEAAVAAFARARLAAQAEGYRKEVEAAEPQARTEALAKALTADGYAATARSAPNPQLGEQLCQHHCPVAHVAEQYPQLCEAETEVFSRLLGTHVQRLATIAHGDGVCTTFVPKAGAGKAAHRTPRTTKTTTASASTAGRNPA